MTEAPRPTILLVDDHPMLRMGLAQLFDVDGHFRVIGEAETGEQALALAASLAPDLVLLDNNMAGMSGLETLRRLRAAGYGGRVLLYTVSDDAEDVREAMRQGANGYLLKDTNPREVLACVRKAMAGEVVISDRLAACLSAALEPEGYKVNLTAREKDVLRSMAYGRSNRAIGEQLGISEETVRVHVRNLFSKIGVHSRVQAVVWAMEQLRD